MLALSAPRVVGCRGVSTPCASSSHRRRQKLLRRSTLSQMAHLPLDLSPSATATATATAATCVKNVAVRYHHDYSTKCSRVKRRQDRVLWRGGVSRVSRGGGGCAAAFSSGDEGGGDNNANTSAESPRDKWRNLCRRAAGPRPLARSIVFARRTLWRH